MPRLTEAMIAAGPSLFRIENGELRKSFEFGSTFRSVMLEVMTNGKQLLEAVLAILFQYAGDALASAFESMLRKSKIRTTPLSFTGLFAGSLPADLAVRQVGLYARRLGNVSLICQNVHLREQGLAVVLRQEE